MKVRTIFVRVAGLVLVCFPGMVLPPEAGADDLFVLTGSAKIGRYDAEQNFPAVWSPMRDAPFYSQSPNDYYPQTVTVAGATMYALYKGWQNLGTIRVADLTLLSVTTSPTYQSGTDILYPIVLTASGDALYCLFGGGQAIGKYARSTLGQVWQRTAPNLNGTLLPEHISVSNGFLYCLFNSGKKLGKYKVSDFTRQWMKDCPSIVGFPNWYPGKVSVASNVIYFLFRDNKRVGA